MAAAFYCTLKFCSKSLFFEGTITVHVYARSLNGTVPPYAVCSVLFSLLAIDHTDALIHHMRFLNC